MVLVSITGLLSYATLAYGISSTALVVETATFVLIVVLIVQFDSLMGEIESILSEPYDSRRKNRSFILFPPLRLNKIFDVRKNTLDKLFDKLDTFSKTWLAVSGGIGSAFIVEIFKQGTASLSTLLIILCAILIWGTAQDLYGILNYKLAVKTKDLELFYLELMFSL